MQPMIPHGVRGVELHLLQAYCMLHCAKRRSDQSSLSDPRCPRRYSYDHKEEKLGKICKCLAQHAPLTAVFVKSQYHTSSPHPSFLPLPSHVLARPRRLFLISEPVRTVLTFTFQTSARPKPPTNERNYKSVSTKEYRALI